MITAQQFRRLSLQGDYPEWLAGGVQRQQEGEEGGRGRRCHWGGWGARGRAVAVDEGGEDGGG